MRRTLLAAAFVLALAGRAEAGARVCHGKATGAAGDVSVALILEDGRATAGLWRWIPPPDPGSSFGARVVLERRYTDLENGILGPIQVVQAVNVVRLDSPKTERAVVSLTTETVGPVVKEWRGYGEAVGALKAGQVPAGMPATGKPANFIGVIPFSARDPGAETLIAALGAARSVATTVSDPQGKVVVSRGHFSLANRGIAEALGREARRLARAAAEKPTEQCEAFQPPAAKAPT